MPNPSVPPFVRPWRRALSLALLASVTAGAIACDSPEPDDSARAAENLDLSSFGVERVVADEGGFLLLGGEEREIGRVDVHTVDGVTELDIELGARVAEVTWSDDGSSLRCDGDALVTENPGNAGWAPQRTPTDAGACDAALAVGFEVASASGTTPPWADQFTDTENEFRWLEEQQVEQMAQTCSTVSTWVGGSSCWTCAQEARSAFGRGNGWVETGSSCSSGTLWTSCSHTFCL